MLKSPWLSMWTSPKETIRNIVSTNPRQGMLLIAIIFGVQYLLSLFYSLTDLGIFIETKHVLFSMIFTPLLGYAWIHIQGGILFWVGKLFKGKAEYYELVSASAWSLLPSLIGFIFWISFYVWLYLSVVIPNPIINGLIFLIPTLVSVWTALLLINCLKELQQYSYAKALGNFFISAFIFGLIVLGFVYIISFAITYLFLTFF